MKIILSRKGFDQENGGGPSPIFPNDRMYSLPIEGIGAPKSYGDIGIEAGLPDSRMAAVAEQLTGGRTNPSRMTHFDPDLDLAALPRKPGWRPAFGQAQAAQGHLFNQGVCVGDVFLFFGWFRRVHHVAGRWTWERSAPHLHAIFGWLQVGEVVEVPPGREADVLERFPWLADHPHLHVPPNELWGRNVVYVASDKFTLPGAECAATPGGGVFKTFSTRLVLTDPKADNRSTWLLPRWFAGHGSQPTLSYHSDPSRWTQCGDMVRLSAVAKGQEFVLDCRDRPEAASWLTSIVSA
jgi:hypothetical protein